MRIMQGKVLNLFVTNNDTQKTRLSCKSVVIDEQGILQDKFYGKNLQRSILITSIHSYKMAQEAGIDIEHGSLGENILIDINPYGLKKGSRIVLDNIELEITQNCTLCQGLSSVNAKLPKLLKNDRGIFAKVIKNKGVIAIGDHVQLKY